MRTTTSRILVPHDGSEMSDKALDKAIEFSKVFKSEIIILHIVDDRLLPSSAILGFIGEKSKLEDAKVQALNILKVGANAMLNDRMEKVKANGISVRFITGMGDPAEGIIDVAEHEHVDLIAMGSRELKREKEFSAG
ncbi:MAG: universal stress protein, partial [Candidatus Nitrosopolaris sp.]